MADRLVLPSLVPIYTWPDVTGAEPVQTGTGFLINRRDRPLLVTATHCLYGHKYDESPFKKYIVFGGRLSQLAALQTEEIIRDPHNDLTTLYVDELGLERCLPMSCLSSSETTCKVITVAGFLTRDFRRSLLEGCLSPQPFLFHFERAAYDPGYVGIRFHKSRNRDAKTGALVQAPRPEGLSGSPMLDTRMLGTGAVVIVGLFTDYVQSKGLAYGETSQKVINHLAKLEELRP
jgi:hypothetical protein